MTKCFRKIHKLWTLSGVEKKSGRRPVFEDLSLIQDGALICVDGKIKWVGRDKDLTPKLLTEMGLKKNPEEIFYKDKVIMPAFVEAHTHTIFGGNRRAEFEMRNQGATYQDIAKNGGGILSTVKSTRELSKKQLMDISQKRVDRFLQQGVGVLEIKSGYGLDETNEFKLLQTAKELQGPKIVPTYLGPHAIPVEVNKQDYQNQILNRTLGQMVSRKLANRVDIFIEDGFFDLEFSRSYFEKAKELNLQICAHVEQLSNVGGTQLAIEYGAKSIEHAIEVTDKEIELLSNSETTAVLLPVADFYLKTAYPRARKMIEAGVRVAVATDFNPGSSPSQDLSLVGVLSRLEMKMTLAEVLTAYIYNAAQALGQEDMGALTEGKNCSFLVLDDELDSLFYSVGYHPVAEVWLNGEPKFKKS